MISYTKAGSTFSIDGINLNVDTPVVSNVTSPVALLSDYMCNF